MHTVIEASYPVSFRRNESQRFGSLLRNHESVVLIGMKRVGISNFLRFFLHHQGINDAYIHNGKKHMFIPIDLNDLVERTLSPFWMLTLKRIVDAIEESTLPEPTKVQSRRYFTESIQLNDQFFTFDCVQKTIKLIVASGYYPSLFFIRFDRIASAITPELFANLQGLKDCVKRQTSFIFTSFRPLYELSPRVFTKSSLSVFSKNLYLTPAETDDTRAILKSMLSQYQLQLSPEICTILLALSGGHVQYLQLSLIALLERKEIPSTKEKLLALLLKDEQIKLQSEELFDSLTKFEQTVLQTVHSSPISDEVRAKAKYLFDTGILTNAKKPKIFNVFFEHYVKNPSKHETENTEFTKKEHLFFTYLKKHEGLLCEREDIIQAVWADTAQLGITDWAIDRLVARVRTKLKQQHLSYEIVTVITRGYKMIAK